MADLEYLSKGSLSDKDTKIVDYECTGGGASASKCQKKELQGKQGAPQTHPFRHE
jgi:hypothetical protein